MKREEIVQRTIKVIKDSAPEFEKVDLKEETVINTDAALDSMGFIYIMCKIEGEFGIKIPEKRWDKMRTLGDLVNEIERAL